MDARDLEAFAQFLQMNGMPAGQAPAKKKPSFWETIEGKATVSVGMFGAAVFLFREYGGFLA